MFLVRNCLLLVWGGGGDQEHDTNDDMPDLEIDSIP
jgi:hypothetical protein